MPAVSSTSRLPRSFVWYVLVGVAKTAGSYAVYACLVQVGSAPQFALFLAHSVVTVLGYRGHARLAFGVPGWSGFWWYVIITTVVYVANVVALAWLIAWQRGPLSAQLCCQMVTIPLGFVLLRWALRPSQVELGK